MLNKHMRNFKTQMDNSANGVKLWWGANISMPTCQRKLRLLPCGPPYYYQPLHLKPGGKNRSTVGPAISIGPRILALNFQLQAPEATILLLIMKIEKEEGRCISLVDHDNCVFPLLPRIYYSLKKYSS